MSKCENCIHEKACNLWLKGNAVYCDHYKDKSLLVELPCRCKDCKHARPLGIGELYICSVDEDYSMQTLVEEDDFCKYAEKLLEVEE